MTQMTERLLKANELETGDTPERQRRLFSFLLSKKVPPIPTELERQPFLETSANIFSRIGFTWLLPILKVGYKRTLVPEDMYYLTEDLKVDYLASKFYVNFDIQLAKARTKHLVNKCKQRGETVEKTTVSEEEDMKDFEVPKFITLFAIVLTFLKPYSISCISLTIAQLSQTLNPLLIKKLIKYVELKQLGLEEGIGKGVGYAIGVTLLIIMNGVFINQTFYRSMCVGALVKAVLTKCLLDKSFKLNAASRHEFPAGKITSIMGTDLSRIDFALGLQPFILVFPVPIIVAIVILIVNIGAVALVGIGLVLVFLIGMTLCSKRLFKFRKTATVFTDARVNYIKECLNNLKMIKYYSWEPPYYQNISDVRKKEMKIVYTMQVLRNIITALAMNLSNICSMITFVVLFAIGGSLDAANIFSSLSIFNVLTQVLFLLPMALAAGSDALVGINRVGQFIAAPEASDSEMLIKPSPETKTTMDSKGLSITLDNATFQWPVFDRDDDKKDATMEEKDAPMEEKDDRQSSSGLSDSETVDSHTFPGLTDITLDIRKAEFLVITGVIGSGKSSLLNAISGFMARTKGQVNINGSLILCGQPWIQNTTVKENIVFGGDFDEKRYSDVIYACSLESDLSLLPAGDRTEIGERGITLSGGQKARINLARSVYVNRDIILLDDVLSAVDARVGKHIMENCINGILKDKTRILATHQLSLVGSADRVIFLNGDGSISVGTPSELEANNEGFRKLMAFNQAAKSEEDEEQEDEDVLEAEAEEIERQLSKKDSGIEEVQDVEAQHKEYNQDKKADGRLVLQEGKNENGVDSKVYKRYFSNGSGPVPPLIMMVLLILNVALATFCLFFSSTWLSFWVEQKFDINTGLYIGVYILLTFCSFIFYMVEFILVVYITNRASTVLNIKAVKLILFSKMSFLDTTPMGRIINRFTKDTDVLDNELGEQTRYLIFTAGNLIGVFILCIIFLPWFALAIPGLAFAVVIAASIYIATSREVKRIESVQRSFVYNNFNESLSGMDTIKAYKAENRFLKYNSTYIDKMNESYLITIATQRWLTIHLALIAASFAFIISILCVNKVFSVGPATTGLMLSYTLQITGQLSMLIRNYTQVENGMTSVERLCDFAYDLDSEAPYEIPELAPPPSWPQQGAIKFDNVSLAYRPGLPLVLKNINADIKSQEKIGICGRTGAGKSSIMTALYRISELDKGRIIIDGVDVNQIGLRDLRSNLSIIPQDPILFKGPIRKTLDPFGEVSDEKLWDSLRRAGLIDADKVELIKHQKITDENVHKFHLDQMVEDDGANFSLGEKQLIAFARALARDSKILILDEATSSVDYETDAKIQATIAREFKHCTILCIAHRLRTILDYDRIIVLDKGEIKEFDTPWNLFNLKDGIFQQMCQKSSISSNDFNR